MDPGAGAANSLKDLLRRWYREELLWSLSFLDFYFFQLGRRLTMRLYNRRMGRLRCGLFVFSARWGRFFMNAPTDWIAQTGAWPGSNRSSKPCLT